MDLVKMAAKIASLPPWDTLGETVRFSNGAVTVIGRTSRSRETGYQNEFTILRYPDWVHVIALMPNREIVIVRQFRHGVNMFTLELPGGAVDSGEFHSEAARRELSEETGFISNKWEYLGSIYANPATNMNFVHIWLAENCELTVGEEPDVGEELEVLTVPISNAIQMCRDGQILHPFTQAALFRLTAVRP